MPSPKNIKTLAIVYDFDGTLSEGSVHHRTFIPPDSNLKTTSQKWKNFALQQDADPLLIYMFYLIQYSQKHNITLDKKSFKKIGRDNDQHLFLGVSDWFFFINQFAQKNGIQLQHFIVSSGLQEIIEGSSICNTENLKIFASKFIYDSFGQAVFPAVVLNDSSKLQYLIKINKGIKTHNDTRQVTAYTSEEERPIPFKNMLYIGDGMTDIPAMKFLKNKGGTSLCVYADDSILAHKILSDNRVDAIFQADYSPNSPLSLFIQNKICALSSDFNL